MSGRCYFGVRHVAVGGCPTRSVCLARRQSQTRRPAFRGSAPLLRDEVRFDFENRSTRSPLTTWQRRGQSIAGAIRDTGSKVSMRRWPYRRRSTPLGVRCYASAARVRPHSLRAPLWFAMRRPRATQQALGILAPPAFAPWLQAVGEVVRSATTFAFLLLFLLLAGRLARSDRIGKAR